MNRYIIIFWAILLIVSLNCKQQIEPITIIQEVPNIFPDYTGVTIPATIAPLNFKVEAEYSALDAIFKGENDETIHVQGKQYIKIPEKKWSRLLSNNIGDSIHVTLSLKQDGKWQQYKPFVIYISKDSIDFGIAYRLIAPGYEVYSKMGIYQRELSSFSQKAIFENTLMTGTCVNCHSFCQTDPQKMTFHIRGNKGGTVLLSNQKINLLKTKTQNTLSKFVYPYWHPSGNYISFSLNNTHQVFHSSKSERVEVVDFASDIVVYDLNNNEAIACEKLMRDSVFETFPTFSSNGQALYFCAAAAKDIPDSYKEVKYNLCSISFDPKTGTLGENIDTLFFAEGYNKSVSFPRPSPDGKYIMFTLFDYGNFSIWHKEADLWLLDLESGSCRPIDEVNSTDTESYHSWSSNSRWFVFSSRRIDGLYTRSFIAHISEDGLIGKPFLLPQENPDLYQEMMESFNIPEFINKKVKINPNTIENLAQKDKNMQVGYRKL